ncbi:hypothetical protein [Streptomyces sp. NRRL B-24484]|uniref:hypothetical protein n=1 Tax=Streptomyces sp. NRRL B-24484 TaxID=1463833 RepID=UPI0004C21111|nr:hypothetical protein [Streptomyces sp. NRRL B-24484]
MARPVIASILFDASWGDSVPEQTPALQREPVVDWRLLRQFLDDNGYTEVRINTRRDGSINLSS